MNRTYLGFGMVALALTWAGCDGGSPPLDGGRDGGCEGRTTCEAAGSSCDGESLVACAPDADGCLVETLTRCGGGCVVEGGSARCGADPCGAVPTADRCEAAGRACVGDTLEVCAANASGCLVRQRTTCDAERGCSEVDGLAVCVGGPCVGAEGCEAESRSCEGDVLQVCERDAGGCLQRADVDCAVTEELCGDRDGMAVCGDTCSFRPPCVPRCEGRMATTCVPDEDGCPVEGPVTDCGDGVCAEGVGCAGNCASAAPQALACNTTVMGNNAGGGNLFDRFGCASGLRFGGPEVIQTISVPVDQWIEVEVTWTAGAEEDYDLFIVDGGDGSAACGAGMTCVDGSIGETNNEYVAFHARAGRVYYMVFTRIAGEGEVTPTDYAMEVGCRPVPEDCTFIGFRPQLQRVLPDPEWFLYEAFQERDSAITEFAFHMDRARAMEGAHTFTFTGENYLDCHTCALGGRVCGGGVCDVYYLAQSGTVTFSELSFSDRRIRGRVDDLRLAEIRLPSGPPLMSTLVPGGRTWCIPTMRFSLP